MRNISKRLLAALLREFNQYVMGYSSDPPHRTWDSLKKRIGWVEEDENTPQRFREENDRALGELEKNFDDETALLMKTFDKLNAVLTLVAIALAVQDVISWPIALVTIAVIWAMVPRAKVWLRDKVDYGALALSLRTKEAKAWNRYEWYWHRRQTRKAVERLFNAAVMLIIVVIVVVAATT